MSEILKVLNRKNIELKSEKVELGGLSSEIEQGYKKGNDSLNSVVDGLGTIVPKLSKWKSELKTAQIELGSTLAKYSKIEKLSNEIGIPVPKPIQSIGKSIKNQIKEVEKWQSVVAKIDNSF